MVADRFAGDDRYETAALLADTFAYSKGEVAVTTGLNLPDALAGGAALGSYSVSVLLTRPAALDPFAHAYLTK